MKRAGWLFAVLVITAVVIHGQKESARSPSKQKNSQSDQQASPPPIGINLVNERGSQQENRPAEHPQSYLSRLLSPENLPNVGLFFVGLFGTLLAISTLLDVKKQTINARIAALAAQKSADALIHGDRAWLLVYDVDPPNLIPIEQQQVPNQILQVAGCFYNFKNMGKTPARMTAWKAELQICDSPDKPDSDKAFDTSGNVFAPSIIPVSEPMPEQATLPNGVITQQQLAEILTYKTKFLWLCGVMKYKDVFREDVEHETLFCYLFETRLDIPEPLWRLAGPAEYNRAT